jgi:hypothetical protein
LESASPSLSAVIAQGPDKVLTAPTAQFTDRRGQPDWGGKKKKEKGNFSVRLGDLYTWDTATYPASVLGSLGDVELG